MGLEHLLLGERVADSVVLAFDEKHGPFRLTYRLTWDESWPLRGAQLVVVTERPTRSLSLQTGGQGHWRHDDGRAIAELNRCVDADIWPTPFTNILPIRRESMTVGERRQFRSASQAPTSLFTIFSLPNLRSRHCSLKIEFQPDPSCTRRIRINDCPVYNVDVYYDTPKCVKMAR